VTLATGLRLTAGRQVRMALDTGIQITPAAGIKAPWCVQFFREGGAPEPTQQWSDRGGVSGGTPLPPGAYRVVIQPVEFWSEAAEWARNVLIEPGKLTRVLLDSGIALAPPSQDQIKLEAPWKVRFYRNTDEAPPAGEPVQQGRILAWNDATPLPPGKYRAGIQPQEFSSEQVMWPVPIEVSSGKVTTLKLDSGIVLKLPAPAGGGKSEFQILSASDGKLVQRGADAPTIVWLPPGKYKLQARTGNDEWKDLGRGVTVEAGHFVDAVTESLP
jgi:hypothetical protein